MSLILKFEGDTRDLETKLKRALKNTGTQVKKLETQTGKSSKKMSAAFASVGKVVGGLGIVIGGAALVRGIGSTISLASDLEESMNKVKEVFGAAASTIVSFSDTAATALGSSKQEALAMTGEIGNLLVAFGLTEKKAAEFTKTIVQSAADIGSFNNVLTKDVLIAYRAALVGSSEPMLRFGADTRVTRLEQIALETGLIKTKRALTSQERAIAAVLAIQKDTAKAQGDFARTSDGLANSTKILKGQMLDLAASIGEGLIPFAKSAVNIMTDLIGIFTDTEFDKAIKQLKELGGDKELIKRLSLMNSINENLQRRVKLAEEISDFDASALEVAQKVQTQLASSSQITAQALELRKTALDEILERQINTAKLTKNQQGVEETRNLLLKQSAAISEKLVKNAVGAKKISNDEKNILAAQLSIRGFMIDTANEFLILLAESRVIEKNITDLKEKQKETTDEILVSSERQLKVISDLGGEFRTLKQTMGEITKGTEDITGESFKIENAFGNIANEGFRFAQALGQGVIFFQGMDTFAKSLLETVNRIAAQLAGRAFAGIIGGAIGFIASGGNPLGAQAGFRIASGFAHGGPVQGGRSIIVGERGPEIFKPNQSGSIIPNNQISNGNTINLYITTADLNVDTVKFKLLPLLRRSLLEEGLSLA